ncbi:acyltransferase family protein [Brevibacterium daeguense]|uniref:acyltransferase family protein n=1 Tax=Brevibacterium daeguense TaxID=909936 RepID=UPI001F3C146C
MQRKFRPEIQLLRAVAVLAVVIYHIYPDRLPGGFVGVDVFFVISGFLITSHILREVETKGRLSLLEFWTNRARRILPAATVAIVVIAVAAPFFLPNTQWTSTAIQGIASVFYVQNFLLAAGSVDYLRQDAAHTPFQHFWSLSVEEQFYLFWPLVVVAALVLARLLTAGRRDSDRGALPNPRVFRYLVFRLFVIIVVASFVYGVIQVNAGDPQAYFVTPARVWELGLGGLLACVLSDSQRFPRLRRGLALAGIAAIAISCVFYDESTPFPGAFALVPTLGAVAVIIAGRTEGPGSLTPVVDWKPVQLVGMWSYSLYLWHFPVITFFVATRGRPGLVEGVALALLSLGLAMVSFYLVEEPVRRNELFRNRRWIAVRASAVAMAAAAAVAVVPQVAFERYMSVEQERVDRLVALAPPSMGAGEISDSSFQTYADGQSVIIPLPAEAREDEPEYPGCEEPTAAADSPITHECVAANPEGSKTLVVVGDSHASQWVPALQEIVEGTDWKVVTFLHNSCPFNMEKRQFELDGGLECTEPNTATLERILEMEPEKVFMTNYAAEDMAPDSDEEYGGTQGYVEVLEPMAEAGIEVIAMHDTPIPGDELSVPDCVAANEESLDECGFDRESSRESEETNGALEAAADQVEGVRFESLVDEFCTEDICPAVIGSVLVYRDNNHVSATYMRTLAGPLSEVLDIG